MSKRQDLPIDQEIDAILATAVRGEEAPWPANLPVSDPSVRECLIERALYHGLAGLLVERERLLAGWPPQVVAALRNEAIARAMWEMRHKSCVCDLLEGLEGIGVTAVVLKGTALAHDLYPCPASRPRGDSDVLISPSDLPHARTLLAELGWKPTLAVADVIEELQEEWVFFDPDGYSHFVDLHWGLVDSPALAGVLPVEEILANARPLPNLCPAARRPDHAQMLLHACLHRAKHFVSPYFAGGSAHFGGNRLIWFVDMHLLAGALDAAEWRRFERLAIRGQVAPVCLDALGQARELLHTRVPESVLGGLRQAPPGSREVSYLLDARGLGRAWSDLRAIGGMGRRLRYLRARLFPDRAFLVGKYPALRHASTARLTVLRWKEFAAGSAPRPPR